MPFSLFRAVAIVLFSLLARLSLGSEAERGLENISGSLRPRELRAASLTADLAKRNFDIPLHYDLSLHYAEDKAQAIGNPYSAQVHLGSYRPVLVLEEIEHLVESVQCSTEAILLVFTSAANFLRAEKTLRPIESLTLVTSHMGCNDDGSRLPYIVSNAYFDDESNTIGFDVDASAGWKDTFHSLKVDFGCSDNQAYSIREHSKLQGRSFVSSVFNNIVGTATSTVSPSLSSVQVSSTMVLIPSSNIAFPTPTATDQITAVSATAHIGMQALDTQILPSNNTAVADIEGQIIPPGLSITCVNCTTAGTVELLSGSFSMSATTPTDNSTDDIIRFIEDGYVEVVANDLFAHIELETTWLAASVGTSFTMNIASIPLTPFSIPDIAVIGPLFNPRIVFGVDVGIDLNFTSGFEVTVPNNSTAIANIGNITQSSLTGFDATSFTMLPFQASVGNLALNLSATLQPQILIGISFLAGADNAGAGIFLELPQLALEIAPAVGTNEKCEPITDISEINNILGLFGNLTHVVPAVEIAGGFVAQATLDVLVFKDHMQTAYTPLATTFAAPTACLAFDKKGSSYVPAAMLATASATPTGGASGIRAPFTMERGESWVGVKIAGMVLGLFFGGFLLL